MKELINEERHEGMNEGMDEGMKELMKCLDVGRTGVSCSLNYIWARITDRASCLLHDASGSDLSPP